MHVHECWVCRDSWQHDADGADDDGCAGVRMRDCPMHEGDPDAGPDVEPYVRRGPMGEL